MKAGLFFGIFLGHTSFAQQAVALGLAVVLGGIIGIEREMRGQAAGLRTHVLVCVGSALITLTSIQIGAGFSGAGKGDPSRLAAQIVSGIGFLGAGAILRDGSTVHGLTTAASVWTTSGIGIALGAGPESAQMAVMATGIVMLTLVGLTRVEISMGLKVDVRHAVITFSSAQSADPVVKEVEALGLTVRAVKTDSVPGSTVGSGTNRVSIVFGHPRNFRVVALADTLGRLPNVTSVDILP